MRNLMIIFGSLLRMALISVGISFLFATGKWLFDIISGKNPNFLISFLGGALGIFVLCFMYALVKTIVTLIRYKKHPIYKHMDLHGGIDWNTYQELHKGN